jgi:hypothetical protein
MIVVVVVVIKWSQKGLRSGVWDVFKVWTGKTIWQNWQLMER